MKCNQRGQSIVEFALITPLLLASLYVAIDFGILFSTASYVQNAARDGARIVSTNCANTSCIGPGPSDVTVSCTKTVPAAFQEACNQLGVLTALSNPSVEVKLTGPYPSVSGNPCIRKIIVTANGSYQDKSYGLMNAIGFPIDSTVVVSRSAETRYQDQPVDSGSLVNQGACLP